MNGIKKINSAQMYGMMQWFQMMNLVASEPVDFDPREHMNDSDPFYLSLLQFMEKDGSRFNYREFIKVALSSVGRNIHDVLIGYESLVERYCDPDLPELQPRADLPYLHPGAFAINGTEAFISEGFNEFRKNASQLLSSYGFDRKFLHVDARGFSTTRFILKNEEDPAAFPVTTYVLAKKDVADVAYKSLSNN